MKILITGGLGYIGSHLAKTLREKNYEVVIFDNFYSNKVDKLEDIVTIKGDIRTSGDLEKIPSVDVVIHLAAQTSVQNSILDPKTDNEINVLGTVNLIDWCRKKNVKKIIYASSAAVYGNPAYLPIDENHPTNPVSPYGVSKLSAEKYIQLENFVILRLANVYGGMKDNSGVISTFIKNLKREEALCLYGDGNQTRDFVNIEDVISAFISAIKYQKRGIFNIGSNKETSLNELVNILREFKPNLKVNYLPKREGDIYRCFFDISKAKKELGYNPKIDLKEGMKKLLEIF
ncbi:MAG: UDP-glucose 4-epimerase [Candidatus Aenigmarchaeota archaeon ex4484_56]|nr:MAG: UDP-glucose 4-epimerase [Candidatus Aenigmarchaeota archaeon ex4484_56]